MSLRASNVTVSYARGVPAAGVPGAGVPAAGVPAAGGPALKGVSLLLEHGRCVSVVGPNGAGKSTLVGALSGQLPLAAGEVDVDGTQLAALGSFALARRIAVVEQSPVLPAGFRVADVVAMSRTPHLGLFGASSRADEAAVEEALAQTGTVGLSSRIVDTLSGGESQRVVLARALAQAADHLLLDEPTNHLDLRHQLEVLAFARRAASAGAAVMLVLHDLNLAARVSDLVVMLAHGEVVAEGPPAAVLTAATISEVYGATVRVLYDDGVPVVVPRLDAEGRLGGGRPGIQ
ncbi:MAG TPA: ABC transporter ATP-binding protein [Trueperaceae bacterium]|nr:ABC transporter ATP-binding protein [Trueperaceae bacterium]